MCTNKNNQLATGNYQFAPTNLFEFECMKVD